MKVNLFPINWMRSDWTADHATLQKRLDDQRWDVSIFKLAIQRKSEFLLKGKWHGKRLVAVRPIENWLLNGNIVVLWIDDRSGAARLRALFFGNIFVTLLFVVMVIQWALLATRILSPLLTGEALDLGESLQFDDLARSPLMYSLSSTTIYIILYLNLVWSGLRQWQKVFGTLTQ